MPITQNPARQGVNLGAAQLSSQAVNYQIGASRGPAVSAEIDPKYAAAANFITGFAPAFGEAVKVNGAKAVIQGAMDAQASVNALADKDENIKKQNLLLQDYYKDGYTQAASWDLLANWKQESVKRAQQAAEMGMSDEDFRQQEQEHVQEMQSKLSNFLPDMDKQAAVATLKQLQTTSAGNLAMFQQGRAQMAVVQADRALDNNLSASTKEFYARVQEGQPEAAKAAVLGGFQAILGTQHLDKDKKLDRVKQYLVSVAQGSQDPALIDQLQQVATEQLGINSVEVNKALYSEFKRAGSQLEASVRFEMDDRIRAIQGLPPEQQEAAMQSLRSEVIKYGSMDVLSAGTQMEMWNKANSIRDEATAKYALQAAISSNQPTTVLAGMFDGDVDKARKVMEQQYPDTVQGNALLMQYGASAKDPWAVQTAQTRMGRNIANTIASLDQLGQDGTLSEENQATIAGFVQMYQQSTDVGKMSLLDAVPTDWRGVVQRAASQNPANASNILFDDVRRIAQNKASGRYNNLNVNPTDDMLDAEGTANWFSFGDTADAQRQEGRAAMEAEYRYIYRTNPEMLVGKSPSDISSMLAGNIQSRKLELEVAGKPRHVYLPPGSSMKSLMGSYQGDTQQYTTALSQVVQSAVDGAVDASKVSKVIIQAGTAGAQGQNLTVTVLDTDGLMHNISINNSQVQDLAQEGYDKTLAGGIKVGEKAVGSRPATFYDADNGRTISMNVSGTNSIGVKPDLFAEIMADTMQFEGYRSKKGKGSVGFGLHDNSGMPVPKELTPAAAVGVLKTSMEKQYMPAVKKQLKSNGLSETPEGMKVLVDLNYHGGNGSSAPVAEAMAQVRKAAAQGASGYQFNPLTQAEAQAFAVLRSQPAYKAAQSSRKKYLEQNMRDWIYATKLSK